MKNILFVCTGNTCRSFMAERLLKKEIKEKGLDITADSCGIYAYPGQDGAANAKSVLRTMGADAEGHRAKQMSRSLIEKADLILTMEGPHMEHIVRAFPEAAVRTHTLLGFAEGLYGYDGAHLRVPDPYGGDTAVYAKCAAVIEGAVLRICEKI